MLRTKESKNFKKIKKHVTPEYLDSLLMSPTKMTGETLRGLSLTLLNACLVPHICNRVGCLPYSHHGRATVTVDESGQVRYADWWGYEITMVELLAEMYGFR